METQIIGPQMQGKIIGFTRNSDGTYDGVIQTSNLNKYAFYNIYNLCNSTRECTFYMATSSRFDDDFEAVNVTTRFLLLQT
jgi:hypothetical protein